MTIKQFAEAQGVSVQAVYKKLRNHGIGLDELKVQEKQGELSESGLERLTTLYKRALNSTGVEKPFKERIAALEDELNQFKARIAELEAENAMLRGKLETYQETTTSAQNTAERLTDALTAMTAAQEKTVNALAEAQRLMDQQQQLHAMQLKALPGGGVRGWFSKLFSRKGEAE